MGNRAVITTEYNYTHNGLGVYLHWNGGRDSVEAFLKYMELRGFRSPEHDETYAWARLCQVIGNFFGGGLSVGVGTVDHLDTDGDNGTYLIRGWHIIGRRNFDGCQEQREHDLNEMLKEIDSKQPEDDRLGDEFLNAVEIRTDDIVTGDVVFIHGRDGDRPEKYEVVGFTDGFAQGICKVGTPYVDRWHDGKNAQNNPNNRLTEPSYRVLRTSEAEEFSIDPPVFSMLF